MLGSFLAASVSSRAVWMSHCYSHQQEHHALGHCMVELVAMLVAQNGHVVRSAVLVSMT